MSKGLDALKELMDNVIRNDDKLCNKKVSVIEKELKALEIIKTKEINIHALLLHLKRFDSPDGYNVLVGDKYKLTQEEYNLLKEILWN